MSDKKFTHIFRTVGEGGLCLGFRFSDVVLKECYVWGF